MASKKTKKTVRSKGAHETPKVRIFIELSRRARRELQKLLKSGEAGTLSNADLKTGLDEVKEPLGEMVEYINVTLADMAELIKSTRGKPVITKAGVNKLKIVRRRVKLMLNHGNGEPKH
jgi:hypothetical protein